MTDDNIRDFVKKLNIEITDFAIKNSKKNYIDYSATILMIYNILLSATLLSIADILKADVNLLKDGLFKAITDSTNGSGEKPT